MLVRLFVSSPFWPLWLLLLIVSCDVENGASLVAESAGWGRVVADNFECDISHLDVWAGMSSFSDGFAKQSHVTVKESAWIE